LPVPKFDLIQSLLRLAPDHRRAALSKSADIAGPTGPALRWYLGGEQEPDLTDEVDVDIILAAGRARKPRSSLDTLSDFHQSDKLPDYVYPARHEWLPFNNARGF